jgi:hypothetical protein
VFASGYLGDEPTLPEFGLFAALNDGTVIELPATTLPVRSASWGQLKRLYVD